MPGQPTTSTSVPAVIACPAGDVLIINEESGLCLTGDPGTTGSTSGPNTDAGTKGNDETHGQSTSTSDPKVRAFAPNGSAGTSTPAGQTPTPV
jgi:hypothetical protein